MKLGVYDFSGGYKGIERAVPGIFPKMTAFYIYTYLENIAYGKKRSKPHSNRGRKKPESGGENRSDSCLSVFSRAFLSGIGVGNESLKIFL